MNLLTACSGQKRKSQRKNSKAHKLSNVQKVPEPLKRLDVKNTPELKRTQSVLLLGGNTVGLLQTLRYFLFTTMCIMRTFRPVL